jgi:hypothetical protein
VACSIPSGAAAGPRAGDHRAAQGAVARSPRFVMRKLRVRGSLVTASGQPGRKAVDGRACVMKARIGLLLTCPACVGGGRLWRQRRLGSASAPTPTPTPATTGPPSSGDPWVISSVSPVPSTAPSRPATPADTPKPGVHRGTADTGQPGRCDRGATEGPSDPVGGSPRPCGPRRLRGRRWPHDGARLHGAGAHRRGCPRRAARAAKRPGHGRPPRTRLLWRQVQPPPRLLAEPNQCSCARPAPARRLSLAAH